SRTAQSRCFVKCCEASFTWKRRREKGGSQWPAPVFAEPQARALSPLGGALPLTHFLPCRHDSHLGVGKILQNFLAMPRLPLYHQTSPPARRATPLPSCHASHTLRLPPAL